MKPNPVGWFEIYVQDATRAKLFYEAVFQTSLEQLEAAGMEMWAFKMEQNLWGAAGALVKMEGVCSGGNSTVVYFSCQDCAEEEGRVVPAGGVVVRPKFAIGQYGFISLVLDIEGNMIGLHSMR